MRRDPTEVTTRLTELYRLLLERPRLKKGEEWKGEWDGWNKGTWEPGKCGVYVLWRNQDDLEAGNRPVYVGEGIVGTRIWDSFHGRKEWRFAQFLQEDDISTPDGRNMRRLLERFAIVVLAPEENAG